MLTRVSLPRLGLIPRTIWLLTFLMVHPGSANPDAKRLYDDLMSNYNRLIRPVGNNSDRLTVKMGLKLSQLIDVVGNPFRHSLTFFRLS